ncbi:hypothetical protein RHS01_10112 [Rhizoctonia solani]|uniref:Retrotransposon gag domain-containing protein n=1 Tax=Rhizoctonia solani TaxID=456999 RepID=A0A8H7I2A5_9AGAM|nr:hypothetical protein RHS01_10112 [Rhizoctonia solani]
MEPEPSLAALLEAITALTATVGSLQDQIKLQGEQITQLTAICKETNNLVGDKDQGGAQTKPGPSTGPVTPPTHSGGKPTLQAQLGLGSKLPSALQEEQDLIPRRKKSQGDPRKSLRERLGDPSVPSLPLTQGPAKIAALTQTTTTSEYVTEFRNLMAELDWNTEAYIAQFVRGLHWKVKELLSTKDNIPDNNLEAIFAASIKIDNIRRENEENRPKKAPAKSPVTATTSTSTTTQQGSAYLRTPTMSPRRKGTVAALLACVSVWPKRARDQTMPPRMEGHDQGGG